MSNTALTIGLIGHSTNSDNLGLGALTASEIAILRTISDDLGIPIRIQAIDWKKGRAHYIGGDDVEIVEIVKSDVLDPRRLFTMFRKADLVIDIGAGDSFADIYGFKRLRLMMAMKYMVHTAGTPMILAPQTMGPFKSPWGRRAALPHLRRCRAVFSRDDLSTSFLREINFSGEIGTASDVALLLPYDAPPPKDPDAPVKVGLNVSGLLLRGGYRKDNDFGLACDYPALIDGILQDFRAREGVELHMVGHVLSRAPTSIEDDYRAGEALAEKYPGIRVAPFFADPSAAKSYIAGLDFFMGARMHATIAAFSSGVPVIPMAYSRKFRGLFGSLGYHRTVDCTSETAEAIRAKINRGFDERAQMEGEVSAALAEGNARLQTYTDRLATVIGEIAARKGAKAKRAA